MIYFVTVHLVLLRFQALTLQIVVAVIPHKIMKSILYMLRNHYKKCSTRKFLKSVTGMNEVVCILHDKKLVRNFHCNVTTTVANFQ